MTRTTALALAAALALLAAEARAQAPFVRGQVVVRGSPAQFPAAQVIKVLPRAGLTVLAVTPGRELAAVQQLSERGHRASLNLVVRAFGAASDPLASYQWHFDRVQASQAWDLASGAGITVAVLDTGLNRAGFADGIGCALPGIDIAYGDTDPADGDGHGTHVAGTIAQATNNGVGVAGLAHGACVLPVKVLDDTGSGSMADIAEGIYWAVDNGAEVINMSLGVSARYNLTSDVNVDPALAYAYSHGVTVVAAAGNDGSRRNVGYPAIVPTVIAVGATDARNGLASYSNRGTGLDLVAPGGNTGADTNGDGYGDGVLQETFTNGAWGYYFFQGTSMASPHVAAAAAVLLSAGAATTPDEVLARLQATALDLGAAGFDSTYGAGLIQLYSALTYTAPLCGDGQCNGAETCDSCGLDCGSCPPPAACFPTGTACSTGSDCCSGSCRSKGKYAGTCG